MYTKQVSFCAGEVTPEASGRTDLQKYSIGCSIIKNCVVKPTGGALTRPGTKMAHEVKDSSKKCRLERFVFSQKQAYVLEFGDHYIRIFKGHSLIVKNDAIYEIATPYHVEDVFDLAFSQSADVLYIANRNYPIHTLTRYADDNWILGRFAHKNGPFMTANFDSNLVMKVAVVAPPPETYDPWMNYTSGTWGNLIATEDDPILTIQNNEPPPTEDWVLPEDDSLNGSLIKLTHYVSGNYVRGAWSSAGNVSNTIKVYSGNNWRLFLSGDWKGKILLECSRDNGTTWATLREFNQNIDTYGNVSEDILLRAKIAVVSSGTCNYELSFDGFWRDGIVQYIERISNTTARVRIVKELGSTEFTSNWAWGSWSVANGYPGAVSFDQDRLEFGGTYAEPQGLWTSQTGIYDDFGKSTPLEDTDAIATNIPSREINEIVHLVPMDRTIALTTGSQWVAGAPGDSALTPTTMVTKPQGYDGASNVRPVVIGNKMLFVHASESAVCEFAYTFESGAYECVDVSILSNHLFEDHKIVSMAYQHKPYRTLWVVRDDGILLGFTYMREQEVMAWHRHETNGLFEDVCVVPNKELGIDEVWFVVKRGIHRWVEYMTKRDVSDVKNYFGVDCGITYSGDPVTEITGLDHLEGCNVSVLADGDVVYGKTVSGGKITLDTAASLVHVGLGYTCDLAPLPIDVQDAYGTTSSRKLFIPEITVKFFKSRGGLIGLGEDESKLVELAQRTNESLGSPIPLKTYDHKMKVIGGFRYAPMLFFRQKDPLPACILAITPKVEVAVD